MRISQQIFARPVVLVGVKENLMTASFVMPVSFEPKYIALSISPKRYTWKLLEKEKYFSVNILRDDQKNIALECGMQSGKNVNKWERASITRERGKYCFTVRECPISFECEKVFAKLFGDHYLVVGKVINEIVRQKQFNSLMHISGELFAHPKPI